MAAFLFPSIWLSALTLTLLLVMKATLGDALPSRRNIFLAVAALLVECVCLASGVLLDHHFGLRSTPWIGKALSVTGLVIFTRLTIRRPQLPSAGIGAPKPNSAVPSMIVFVALLILSLSLTHLSPSHQTFSLNTLLFMALASGVDEELTFRGLMPFFLVNPGAEGQRKLANAFIASAIPTTAFAVMHAWHYANGHSSFNMAALVFSAIGACGFMYIRQRSCSIVYGMVAHNLINALTFIALSLT